MKSDDLFEIIGDISDRHIDGAKKTKNTGMWKKWTAMAACLCIVVAAAFMITLRVPDGYEGGNDERDYTHDDCPNDDCIEPDYPVDNGPSMSYQKTSETYGSLDELLKYLSRNDNHTDKDSNGGGRDLSSSGDTVLGGVTAAAYNGYVYRVGDGCVEILNFDGEVKGIIECFATELFVCGDKLVLKGGRTVGNELNYDSYSSVCVYNLENPLDPVCIYEYEQKGELAACYVADGKIYLITFDGVCACGYSRYSDLSQYQPSLTINGQYEPWEDENIKILGEPTSVNYVAISVFNVQAGEITEKQAFYGDIEDIFYGEGWLAVITQSRTEKYISQPDVYTFDGSLTYTGKIDIAEITGIDRNNSINDEGLTDGIYITLTSVFKSGETYCGIGTNTQVNGEENVREVFAVTADTTTGKVKHNQMYTENDLFNIDDILWEDNGAIVCISSFDLTTGEYSNKFVAAEFDGTAIDLYLRDFGTDPVSGVENYYAYGSPYGNIKTLIPLGGGVYLRYNGVPDGFDVFDFSDISSAKLLYKSTGEIADDERFDFIWHKLDNDKYGNVFGVMTMKIGAGENIRETEFSYRIYRVDPYQDEVFLLLNEYTFGKGDSFSSSSLGFEVFEYEGEYYFVTQDSDAVTKIEF